VAEELRPVDDEGADATPLWQQVAREIRDRIVAGEYRLGFPTEFVLATDFGVSRATVRQALGELKDEGLLTSRRGSGTFVGGAHVNEALFRTSFSLAKEISSRGLVETSEVLDLRLVQDVHAARALGMEPEQELVYVSRLRLGSGVPLAIDYGWLRAPEANCLLGADLRTGSIYEVLVRDADVVVVGGVDRFLPHRLTVREATLLSAAEGEPSIVIERHAYVGRHLFEYRRTVLAGERLTISAQWGYGPER
jgi:GntR family transcriptional regulator